MAQNTPMRLGHFDMNLFVVLDALLDLKSVTKASERLCIGASATSSALGRLREHFKDDLLVQIGRRMELTPLADALREPVRDILLRSQSTLTSKDVFDPATAQRRFVFNASDYSATVFLAPLLHHLSRVAPGLSLDIVELGNNNLAKLERGEVDIALYPERNASPDYPAEILFEEDYVCVVWEGSRYAGPSMAFADYVAGKHISVRMGEQRVPSFEEWFLSAHGIKREVVAISSTFNAQPLMIQGTDYIATMHKRLAQIYARLLPLRLLTPDFKTPGLRLVMQWNHYNSRDAGHRWLREQLKTIRPV